MARIHFLKENEPSHKKENMVASVRNNRVMTVWRAMAIIEFIYILLMLKHS